MAEVVEPQKVMLAVKKGFDRLKRYRAARTMFIKEYVGQYYAKDKGLTGDQPINLIFHAIRTIVPNIVMQNPLNEVITEYLSYKTYAELLGMGLDVAQRQLRLKEILRAWIVDAIFAVGILQIGLNSSQTIIKIDDVDVDPGQIFVDRVDLDDFVVDPVCKEFTKATFAGNAVRVPRQTLLDDPYCDHDLVTQLPSSNSNPSNRNKIESLTQESAYDMDMNQLQDMVDVVQLWVPSADAFLIMPDPRVQTFDKYIKLTDYYGPKEGPYVYLCLTPPVADNPMPVAPVSIWYDLHRAANKMMSKMLDQATRQKDITFYKPAAADEMQDAIDADDGATVASEDPKAFQTVSFGGQRPENESMLRQLQVWFNYMAGNPDLMSGARQPSGSTGKMTATQSSILQSNASLSTEDSRDLIYTGTEQVSNRMAWFLHTDPLINILLAKRMPGGEYVQVMLTPEQRCGDFNDFIFTIIQRSMSRLDPETRQRRIIDFTVNVIPAAVATAMQCLQMGIPFNLQRYLSKAATELGIGDWIQDIFNDPEHQQKLMAYMMLGPQNPGKGQIITPGAIQQNGGYPLARPVPTAQQEFNQNSQRIAGEQQSENFGVY
ncbi:MAG TPA: hypothetical protein VMW50_08170 [Dehalococcoidia bacterium]|nr:hypothetical protein [Dehalococcoidia bacterium]